MDPVFAAFSFAFGAAARMASSLRVEKSATMRAAGTARPLTASRTTIRVWEKARSPVSVGAA